jgi:hypothetical protein
MKAAILFLLKTEDISDPVVRISGGEQEIGHVLVVRMKEHVQR